MTGRRIPDATRIHFLQSVAALGKWCPAPMSSTLGRPGRVDVVWEQGGILEDMNEKQRKLCDKSRERRRRKQRTGYLATVRVTDRRVGTAWLE